ncbi:MAG TPA: hypothetical protein VHQ64_07630, partial [Pyrinomonadaceae bacterium]|nr:hypothetical protein [Pyrinomonadaceae bacterium]
MTKFVRLTIAVFVCTTFLFGTFQIRTSAQRPPARNGASKAPVIDGVPDEANQSEMRQTIESYVADRGSLQRSFFVNNSPARRERFRKFYQDNLDRLQKMNFDAMSQEGKVDYILFRTDLEHELRQLDIEAKQQAEIEPLMPFARTIVEMEETRRSMTPIDPAKSATTLNGLKKQVDDTRRRVEAGLRGGDSADAVRVKKTVAFRGVNAINALRGNLRNWYTFYNGYDPVFTWWNEQPYRELDEALTSYGSFISERLIGLRTAGPANAPGQGGGGQRGGGAPGVGGQGGGAGQGGGGGFQRPGGAAQARPGDTSDIIGDPIGHD